MRPITSIIAAVLVAAPGFVAAQGAGDGANPGPDQNIAGYRGIARTPAGALPQIMSNTQLGLMQNGASVVLVCPAWAMVRR
jgi:hypothetical protein